MRKICFIYRKSRPEYFSIEKVFGAVKKKLESFYSITEITVPHSRVTILHLLQNLRFISRCRADIYHVTGDAHYLALGRPGNKTVLTIHDCVFLQQRNKLKRFFLKKIFLDLPVRHARIITTISENSKADIISNTGCAANKVVVIPNPVDENIYYSPKDFNIECPVFLFVGTTSNKNLERVILALRGLNCVLDIIGKIPTNHKVLLQEEGIRYNESFSISSSDLADKYAKADLLLFPSTFEGFGLPIIEAQKAGRVVVTSNLSPMKEVAAKGAYLVDPFEVESIRNGILEIMERAELRNNLVQQGLQNVKRFSAEEAANGYRKVYDSFLS